MRVTGMCVCDMLMEMLKVNVAGGALHAAVAVQHL